MLRNPILHRPIVLALMAIMILFFSFCGNREESQRTATKSLEKSDLAKVSPELALIEENNNLNEQLNCSFSENNFPVGVKIPGQEEEEDKKKPPTPSENEFRDWADQSLEKMANRHKALCDAYKVARSEMQVIAEWAKKFKKAPSEAFLFYIWDSPDESEGCSGSLVSFATEPCEDIVGLFTSIEKCNEVEDKVRVADIGTRPCRVWNKELVYIFMKDSPKQKSNR